MARVAVTSGRAATTAHLLAVGRIGEVVVLPVRGGFEIRHRDDERRAESELERVAPDDAVEVAKYTEDGAYRSLKTAPNLRHGWLIPCAGESEVECVIEQLYPGRIAALQRFREGTLVTTALRETLDRQTGMYKVAAKISDEQIDDLVAGFCRSDGGCLRTILWRRDAAGAVASTKLPATKFDAEYDQTGREEASAPLVCQEGCNLLVNEARKVVKGESKFAG